MLTLMLRSPMIAEMAAEDGTGIAIFAILLDALIVYGFVSLFRDAFDL